MSKTNNKSVVFTIIKAFIGIILIAVLATAIYGVVYFTNGMTTEFKSFYLEYNGKIIRNNITAFNMQSDKEITFDTRYLLSSENKGYFVEIVQNSDNDFDFIKNGTDQLSWCGDIDIKDMYKIKKKDSSFTISVDFDILKGLKSKYGEDIKLVDDVVIDNTKSYFTLLVKSYNEKIVYEIDLIGSIEIVFPDKPIVF